MKEYLKLSAFEIAEINSFIKWCKGHDAAEDWTAWLSEHPTQSQKIEEAKKIVLSFQFKEELPLPNQEKQIWSKISDQIDDSTKPINSPKLHRKPILRRLAYVAAACLTIFVMAKIFNSSADIREFAALGETKEVILPGGSIAILNAESKIVYSEKHWSKNREVSIEGEVFFDVKKGSSFKVNTRSGMISVLGTSFNVFDRKGILSVQCETGKVQVNSRSKETILMANQAVVVKNNTHIRSSLTDNNILRSSWKTGIYYYQDAPLGEVLEDLERQLEVAIQLEDKYRFKEFTGSFNIKNGLDALNEVLWTLNLSFQKNGDKIKVIDK